MQSSARLIRSWGMGKKNKRKTGKSGPVTARRPITRRRMFGLLLGVPLVGVAGVGVHRYDVKKRALHDLSVVGNGTPTIVQVHDPACRLCRRLMSNTREALSERDDINYRIADVTTSKGREFQQRYDVPNVTLLLFNAKGRHVDTIQGVTPVSDLAERFEQRLVRTSG